MINKLFEDYEDAADADDNLQTPVNLEIPENDPLSAVVGEGKFYKTQAELVKGLLEKEALIKRQQSENKLLRGELQTRGRVEEIVDKLLNNKVQNKNEDAGDNSGDPSENSNGVSTNATQGITKDEIVKLLEEKDKQKTLTANLETARKALVASFGSDAPNVLKKRAEELGVSVDYLNKTAAESPQAFIALFPAKQVETPVTGIPNSSSNTFMQTQANPGGAKANSFYKELQKKDISLYLSPRIQNQMYKDAMKLGEKFYD
jgi:hypothetical protein